jgi:4-hydroxy-2-oxoheptanedioate aldolase
MKTNRVRAKLKRGEPSVGTWLTLADSVGAQLMAGAGFDWLTVELEHSHLTFEHAARAFAIIAASGCVPLVRVPLNSTENIKRVLDTGAWGIVVPMVNSRAECEAVVRAARYRPIGQRTIGGQLGPVNFATDAATYFANANDEILLVVMAETAEAVANIDDILSVPGIDAVFVGPNDLHASLGAAPAFESALPAFNDALARILASAKKHGIAPGIHVQDSVQAKRRIEEGWQFVAVSSEAGLMLAKAAEIVKELGLGSGAAAVKY